jgi:hypothetical protein
MFCCFDQMPPADSCKGVGFCQRGIEWVSLKNCITILVLNKNWESKVN